MLCFFLIFAVHPTRAEEPTEPDYQILVERMVRVAAGARDMTYRFYRSEWVHGAMSDPEELFVKWRLPLDIYLRWTGTNRQGQEALFGPDLTDGLLTVNPAGIIPTVSINPAGSAALRSNRHPISEVALTRTVRKIVADNERALANPGHGSWTRFTHRQEVFGEAATCFEARLAKDVDPAYYCHRAELCINDRTGLPARVRSHDIEDGSLRLVEDYGFGNIQVDVGLTDMDFDTDNPDYNL